MIKNMARHFKLVTTHKKEVFRLCCIAGIPLQGVIHDLSKYSAVEFLESAKYYTGKNSPIENCKADKGYSMAWLHHKGHNPHHFQYWVDNKIILIIPYKYSVEMCCDMIAAGRVYLKDKWTKEYPLEYWLKNKNTYTIHPDSMLFLEQIFTDFVTMGEDALKPKHTRKVYNTYIKDERYL